MQTETTAEFDAAAIRAMVLQGLLERANALGWYSRNANKLTKKGDDEALSYLVGVARGFELAQHPAANWLASIVFLASIRGALETLKEKA